MHTIAFVHHVQNNINENIQNTRKKAKNHTRKYYTFRMGMFHLSACDENVQKKNKVKIILSPFCLEKKQIPKTKEGKTH